MEIIRWIEFAVCLHRFTLIFGISVYRWKCRFTSMIAWNGFNSSPYLRLSTNWDRFSIPPTRMCKWFNVVIELVKFFFAKSNCFMSSVISFTLSSVFSARVFISDICSHSWPMTFWASANAQRPSWQVVVWLRTTERIFSSISWHSFCIVASTYGAISQNVHVMQWIYIYYIR